MNQNQKQGLTQLTATICEKIRQKKSGFAETSTLRAYAGGVTVLSSGQTAAAACMTTDVTGAAKTVPTFTLNTSVASCLTGVSMK